MPELPEVQTVVNDLLSARIIGAKINQVYLFWQKSIACPDPCYFPSQVQGQEVLGIERRGKYIFIKLSSGFLLIHLRMSGRFLLDKTNEPIKHERVRFILSDDRLIRFIDQRKFGRLYFLKDASALLNRLGIDPLSPEFTPATLMQLMNRKGKMKSLLLNQKIIAGIGNIYADEALWEAQIHPETLGQKLQPREANNLCQAIKKVLHSGLTNRGTSLGQNSGNFHAVNGESGKNSNDLKVYKKEGLPCRRCKTLIIKIKLNGRGTHLCAYCQVKK